MNRKHRTDKGFTIIELMLAMAFLSFMLIFVIGSLVQVLRIYNHGLTLKLVNQNARSIGLELQRSLRESKGDGVLYLTTPAEANRLCLGQYSFVWNEQAQTNNLYNDGTTPVRFARVHDPGQSLCIAGTNGLLPRVDQSKATELLSPALIPQSVALTRTTTQTNGSYLYQVKYIIGTTDQNIIDLTDPDNPTCRTDDQIEAQFCALSSFTVNALAKR